MRRSPSITQDEHSVFKKLKRELRRPLSLQSRDNAIRHVSESKALSHVAISFARFLDLPLETRACIWGLSASEPRIVDVYFVEGTRLARHEPNDAVGYTHWKTPLPNPSCLSACREARIEALKIYSLQFARPQIELKWPSYDFRWTIIPKLLPRIYYSRFDTLYVHEFTKPSWSTSIADRCKKDIKRVKLLAINIEDWWNADTGRVMVRDHLGYKLQQFYDLEVLTFVLVRQGSAIETLNLDKELQFFDIERDIGIATKMEKAWNMIRIRTAVQKEMKETHGRFPAWREPAIRFVQLRRRLM